MLYFSPYSHRDSIQHSINQHISYMQTWMPFFALCLLTSVTISPIAIAQQSKSLGSSSTPTLSRSTQTTSTSLEPSTASSSTTLLGLRSSPNPATKSLQDVLDALWKSNTDIQVAQLSIEKSVAQHKQIWALLLPQISISADATWNIPETKATLGSDEQFQQQALLYRSIADVTAQSALLNPDPQAQRRAAEQAEALRSVANELEQQKAQEIVIQPSFVFSGALTFSMPVFQSGLYTALAQTKQAVSISQLAAGATRSQLAFQVAQLYLNIVSTVKMVSIAQEQLKNAQTLQEQIDLKSSLGQTSSLVQKNAAMESIRAKQQLEQAQQGLMNLKATLGNIVGWVDDYNVVDPQLKSVTAPTASTEILTEKAWSQRADSRIQQKTLEIAEQQRLDAWMRYLPSVQLVAQARYSSNTSGFSSNPIGAAIILQASIPLWDSGKTHHTIQEQQIVVQQETLKLHALKRTIEQNIRGLLLQQEIKQTALQTNIQSEKLAVEQHQQSLLLLEVGMATPLDVMSAHTALAGAQAEKVRAENDLALSTLMLYLALGDVENLARNHFSTSALLSK
jgi:outer membrane protein TolC